MYFVKSRYFTQKAASETKKKTKKKEKEDERGGDMDVDRFSTESQSDSDMDFAGYKGLYYVFVSITTDYK